MTATSPTIRDYLQSQHDQKLEKANELIEAAASAARSMAPDEKRECEQLLDDANKIKGQIGEIDSNETLAKAVRDARGPVMSTPEEVKDASTIGEAFVKSEGFQRIKGGAKGGSWSTGLVEFDNWTPSGVKATTAESTSAIVQPDVQPGILPILTWPLTVADLMPQGSTSGNSVKILKETVATNAADAVDEGGDKPESTITFDDVDEPVRKIATFLPVTDEFLEDVPGIQSYLNTRLSLFVRMKEDTELLLGTGVSPHLAGIMDDSRSIQTGSALSLDVDSVIDAIYQAMTLVQTGSLLAADGIVVNPTDWAAIRLMKDLNKQYYGGGPFTGAYGGSGGIAGNELWGLPVVVTTAITAGTILIGAFKTAAQVFRRSGLTVEASNSHSDFFTKNKTAIRAETRLALAVYRPAAFYALTGANLLEGS